MDENSLNTTRLTLSLNSNVVMCILLMMGPFLRGSCVVPDIVLAVLIVMNQITSLSTQNNTLMHVDFVA